MSAEGRKGGYDNDCTDVRNKVKTRDKTGQKG